MSPVKAVLKFTNCRVVYVGHGTSRAAQAELVNTITDSWWCFVLMCIFNKLWWLFYTCCNNNCCFKHLDNGGMCLVPLYQQCSTLSKKLMNAEVSSTHSILQFMIPPFYDSSCFPILHFMILQLMTAAVYDSSYDTGAQFANSMVYITSSGFTILF
jgi:hypothetical protein